MLLLSEKEIMTSSHLSTLLLKVHIKLSSLFELSQPKYYVKQRQYTQKVLPRREQRPVNQQAFHSG